MKDHRCLTILCTVIAVFALCNLTMAQSLQTNDTLRVMSFNLYGMPNSEWETRLQMILDELEILQPDLIALQEVIEPNPTVNDRARILADSLFARTGFAYDSRYFYTHFSWDTWDEGIGLLSKHLILDSDFQVLPAGLFQRKVFWARTLTTAGVIDIFGTHLSFGNQAAARLQQVAVVKDFIAAKAADQVATLSILCGDFNDTPNSPPILFLTQPDSSNRFFRDSWAVANPGQPGFTMPSDNPTSRIDYVFLKGGDMGSVQQSQLTFTVPNANNLYPSDHLGVLSELTTTNPKVTPVLLSPVAGNVVMGTVPVLWSVNHAGEPLNYTLYISDNGGISWSEEWSGADTTHSWNTLNVNDGTQYRLQVVAKGDSTFGLSATNGTFTVNNPGNSPPQIGLSSPSSGQTIQGIHEVRWTAADPDGDLLTIALDVSNDGATYQNLVSGLTNSGSYLWDTRALPNSPFYRLILKVADDSLQVADTSGTFTIDNIRSALPDSIFRHVTGEGDGSIGGNIFDAGMTTDHLYRITFDDTSGLSTSYSVRDVTRDSLVVSGATALDGLTEGPAFDGLRLTIFDLQQTAVNPALTGWIASSTTLTPSVTIPQINIGGQLITGIPYPADYHLTIFDQIVDTSSTHFGVPAVPMQFTVKNISEDRQVEVIFIEQDNNNKISLNDAVYILEPNEIGEPQLTWFIFFSGPLNPVLPAVGDVFLLSTLQPFTADDIFEFTLATSAIANTGDQIPARIHLSQNYPNPFNPVTAIRYALPKRTTVNLVIYNILGQRVRRLVEANQAAGIRTVIWDGKDAAGHRVASGVYLYQLKTSDQVLTRKMLLVR